MTGVQTCALPIYARVAGSGVVMVAGYDSVAQVGVSGDIDTVLVSQDACVVTPIGKAGAESSRGSTRESMEGIENEWVRSRGGAKLVREGSIDEVDKECFREEGDRFIICVGCGDMIWATGQSVWGTEIFSRDVCEGEVEFGQIEQPSGLAAI